jgi:hypothetical protein
MRASSVGLTVASVAILTATAAPVCGQTGRVAVFGNAGRVEAHAEEHDRGKMAMYGGELVFTLRGTLRAGLEVEVGRIRRGDLSHPPDRRSDFDTAATITPFEFKQTAITVSILREWPATARVRGFAGAGLGVLLQDLGGWFYGESAPWSDHLTPEVIHLRGGMVGSVNRHLCIRGEVAFSTGGGAMGYFGGRAGVGYVF